MIAEFFTVRVVVIAESFTPQFPSLSSWPHAEDYKNRNRTESYEEVISGNHRTIGMETLRPFAEETSVLPSSSAPHESSSVIAAEGSDPGKSQTSVGNFGTLTRLRHGECAASDCRVLITGCGRSGTHFLAEQLAGGGMHERRYQNTRLDA